MSAPLPHNANGDLFARDSLVRDSIARESSNRDSLVRESLVRDAQQRPPNLSAVPPSASHPPLRLDPLPTKRHAPGYSRFVSMMKIVLPALALTLVSLVVVWPQLTGPDGKFKLGFSNLSIEQTDRLNMVNARYFGTDDRNQPFTVTADLATEAEPGSQVIELTKPKADVSLNDGTWLVLGSEKGFYTQKTSILSLQNGVNLYHDGGYEITTSVAKVNLKEGIAGGDEPIQGQGPFGAIKGEGFRLLDKGRRIFFTGKVHLTLYPGANTNLR